MSHLGNRTFAPWTSNQGSEHPLKRRTRRTTTWLHLPRSTKEPLVVTAFTAIPSPCSTLEAQHSTLVRLNTTRRLISAGPPSPPPRFRLISHSIAGPKSIHRIALLLLDSVSLLTSRALSSLARPGASTPEARCCHWPTAIHTQVAALIQTCNGPAVFHLQKLSSTYSRPQASIRASTYYYYRDDNNPTCT